MNQGFIGWSSPALADLVLIRRVTVGIDVAAPAATVVFPDIPQNFRNLVLRYQARGDTAAAFVIFIMQFNGDATAANYPGVVWESAGAATNTQNGVFVAYLSANTATAGQAGAGRIEIPNYAGTTFWKDTFVIARETNLNRANQSAATWQNLAAITTITLLATAGGLVGSSVFSLYGEP